MHPLHALPPHPHLRPAAPSYPSRGPRHPLAPQTRDGRRKKKLIQHASTSATAAQFPTKLQPIVRSCIWQTQQAASPDFPFQDRHPYRSTQCCTHYGGRPLLCPLPGMLPLRRHLRRWSRGSTALQRLHHYRQLDCTPHHGSTAPHYQDQGLSPMQLPRGHLLCEAALYRYSN